MKRAHSRGTDREPSGNPIAVFSRNLKTLLFSRGLQGNELLRSKLGVTEKAFKLWTSGACLPSPEVVRQIHVWAGLPDNFNLTRQLLVDLERRNVAIIRARWIEQISRMPASEILELQPGLDRILFAEERSQVAKCHQGSRVR
jgi:hypothetical protein